MVEDGFSNGRKFYATTAEEDSTFYGLFSLSRHSTPHGLMYKLSYLTTNTTKLFVIALLTIKKKETNKQKKKQLMSKIITV